MPQVQEPTPPHVGARSAEEPGRGRPRSRTGDRGPDGLDITDDGADADPDGNHANSSNSDGPARKRRRSRKGLDKKFECPEKGCGKSYSRAEHLYDFLPPNPNAPPPSSLSPIQPGFAPHVCAHARVPPLFL